MAPLSRARLALRVKHYHCPRSHVRYQHGLPHKEYFQNPVAHPLAETPPPQFASTLAPESPATERPLSQRVLRSIVWAVLFSTLGFAGVEAQKTVRWLDQSPGDSKNEEEDMQEIKHKFKDDPLVQILEADPSWQSAQPGPNPEIEPYPFVQHVDPYMSKAIGGSRGLQMVGFL
jgi:hypothetical protein